MEGDLADYETQLDKIVFQSTPSAWRETDERPEIVTNFCISIHSLRMEGDHVTVTVSSPSAQFQSTPSAWRETYDRDQLEDMDKFQSTPSAWRET